MKITVEHYDEKVSIETKQDDITIVDFMDYIKRIASAIYGENLVNNCWEFRRESK